MASKALQEVAKATAARVAANTPDPKPKPKRIPPTPEQCQHGNYESAGMAFRRVPAIDTLLEAGKLTQTQHALLNFYRYRQAVAEGSQTKSCLDIRIRGGSGGTMPISAEVVSAIQDVGRIEKDLGSLLDIAQAVAINDLSLTQWCCAKFGSRVRYDGKGRFVAFVPVNERKNMAIALLEIRTAAGRITT